MNPELDQLVLDQLFLNARSYNSWLDAPVTDEQLRKLYDILKMGPTSFNCCPARFVFLSTTEGKERISPHLRPNNVKKTLTAPVVTIIAHDMEFYEEMPKLVPHRSDVRDLLSDNEALIMDTAFRNATLQGGYFLLAARAIGIDCAPMSGFDNQGVDEEFFPDGRLKSNFICGLGRGDPESTFDRLPRLPMEEACTFL